MDITSLTAAYKQAKKRLLLLDYDGTVVEFNQDPMAATPSAELLDILEKLTADPANTVVVVSGRPAVTLEGWLGHLPLGFSAEHGFLHKKPGSAWETATAVHDEWKTPVRALMDLYADQAPGTSVEEKVSALTWHWRAADDPKTAARIEEELLAELEKIAGQAQIRILRILRGNKVVEVHPLGFDKGTGGKYWLDQADYDFILAAGDDTTDEDLFRAMPKNSFVIKVGAGETGATLHTETPASMRQLLGGLVTD